MSMILHIVFVDGTQEYVKVDCVDVRPDGIEIIRTGCSRSNIFSLPHVHSVVLFIPHMSDRVLFNKA